MKTIALIIIVASLLLSSPGLQANTLNEVVKEARRQGQVLSAKTYRGVHEVRVVTPQGSVKTIRKPAEQNQSNQSQANPLMPLNYNQPTQEQDSRPEFQQERRKPNTRRSSPREPQRSQRPQRRQPQARRRSNDRNPD